MIEDWSTTERVIVILISMALVGWACYMLLNDRWKNEEDSSANYLCLNILLLAGMIICRNAIAGPYIEGGLGYSPFVNDSRCTEVCFKDELLAYGELGWRIRKGLPKGLYTGPKLIHISAPKVTDKGFDAVFWGVGYEW